MSSRVPFRGGRNRGPERESSAVAVAGPMGWTAAFLTAAAPGTGSLAPSPSALADFEGRGDSMSRRESRQGPADRRAPSLAGYGGPVALCQQSSTGSGRSGGPNTERRPPLGPVALRGPGMGKGCENDVEQVSGQSLQSAWKLTSHFTGPKPSEVVTMVRDLREDILRVFELKQLLGFLRHLPSLFATKPLASLLDHPDMFAVPMASVRAFEKLFQGDSSGTIGGVDLVKAARESLATARASDSRPAPTTVSTLAQRLVSCARALGGGTSSEECVARLPQKCREALAVVERHLPLLERQIRLSGDRVKLSGGKNAWAKTGRNRLLGPMGSMQASAGLIGKNAYDLPSNLAKPPSELMKDKILFDETFTSEIFGALASCRKRRAELERQVAAVAERLAAILTVLDVNSPTAFQKLKKERVPEIGLEGKKAGGIARDSGGEEGEVDLLPFPLFVWLRDCVLEMAGQVVRNLGPETRQAFELLVDAALRGQGSGVSSRRKRAMFEDFLVAPGRRRPKSYKWARALQLARLLQTGQKSRDTEYLFALQNIHLTKDEMRALFLSRGDQDQGTAVQVRRRPQGEDSDSERIRRAVLQGKALPISDMPVRSWTGQSGLPEFLQKRNSARRKKKRLRIVPEYAEI